MAIWGAEIMDSGARSMTATATGMLSFQRRFRIHTDDKKIEQYTIFQWLQEPSQNLQLGKKYKTNYTGPTGCPYSYLTSLNLAQEADDGVQWLCTANYEPFNMEVIGQLNPLKAFAQPSLSFETHTEAVPAVFVYDAFGIPKLGQDGRPIIKQCVNSAGQLFTSPITKEMGEPVLRITRNETTRAAYDTLNITPFFDQDFVSSMIDCTNLFGGLLVSADNWLRAWPPKTLRFTNVDVQWNLHPIWGVYYTVQYLFKVSWRPWGPAGPPPGVSALTTPVAGWVDQVLDKGSRSIDPVTGLLSQNYFTTGGAGIQVISDPQLLDGNGVLLKKDPITGIMPPPVYLPFEKYAPRNFDAFGFTFPPVLPNIPSWYHN